MNVRFTAFLQIMTTLIFYKVEISQEYSVTVDLNKHPNGTIVSSEIFNRCSNVNSIFYYFRGSGIIIFLELIYLNLPQSYSLQNCPHRRLEIRQDGHSTISYCGKIISKSIIQAFNKLEVVYINDGGDISSCQYSMKYYSAKMVSCGAHVFHQNFTTFEWNDTVFTTPYYPYPGLPPKTDCDIRFIAQPKYRVAIQFLDVDIVPSEKSDHINLFSIISGFRHSLITRICSQISSSERYFSDQSELYIQIKTFSNARRRGVRFKTKYVHENELSQYLSDSEICGQNFFNESSGTIKLNHLNRLNHLTCAWHIQAALGWKVQLRVINLNLGKSKKCSNKYLVIYNSPPRSDLQPTDRLCGSYVQQSPHNIVVLSDRSHMFIRLFKLPKTSFTNNEFIHLEYSVVNTELKNDSCPGFHCHGGQICTDPEKLLCYAVARYCIPWELRCDHRSSCAKFDNSDEESCLFSNLKTHFTTILLTVSLILILSLFLAFAFCNMRPKFIRKSRQNNLSTDSMEITENQFSLRNIDPKFLIEKEERINTIHCNHQQMPDINYPSASSSFYLFYNNDVSRVTFTNHHTES